MTHSEAAKIISHRCDQDRELEEAVTVLLDGEYPESILHLRSLLGQKSLWRRLSKDQAPRRATGSGGVAPVTPS